MQPIEKWSTRIKTEKNLWIKTAAMIALARASSAEQKATPAANESRKLIQIDYHKLDSLQLRLDVPCIDTQPDKGGQPSAETRSRLINWIDGFYPAVTHKENRNLSAIMQFLQALCSCQRHGVTERCFRSGGTDHLCRNCDISPAAGRRNSEKTISDGLCCWRLPRWCPTRQLPC